MGFVMSDLSWTILFASEALLSQTSGVLVYVAGGSGDEIELNQG